MAGRKKIIIILSGLALALGLLASGYFLFKGSPAPAYNFTAVTRGNIQEEVNLTGTVKPAQSVSLAFERSAKIASSNFKVGDQIKTGQAIASLVSADLSAQLSQAQAALDGQTALLKNLKAGASPADMQVSLTQVQNAQNNVADAQSNLSNVQSKADNDLSALYGKTGDILNDAYAKAFDALHNKTDDIFNNGSSDYPTLALSLSNSALKNDLETQRPLVSQELALMKNDLDSLNSDQTVIDSALASAVTHLEKVRDYLNQLSDALNFAVISSAVPQSQIFTYKSNLSLGLSNLNLAITNLNGQTKAIATQKITNQNSITSAQSQLNQAENNLSLAQKQLQLKQAGATAEQIAAQQAAVNQAAAAVQNIRAQLAKSAIVSPLDGIISRNDAKMGEIATINLPLISIISSAKFQIETPAPEADIEKIKIGQLAQVTLDADNSQQVFTAKIIIVDPAKTVINGATTYKVTLEFLEENQLIKDSLTANLAILTASQTDTLLIPASAVIKQGNQKIVLVNNGSGMVAARSVTTGIRQNGFTEILSGLTEGEQVATFGR